MTSVTATLIVRNEERFLPGCLESLRNSVDDIVIVDTGSTDDTIGIAHAAGVSVSAFQWNEDFSAARNAALARVSTPWTLYIDADERVSVPGNFHVGHWLDEALHVGGYVRFRPRPGYTRYREPRLFRTDPAIRFSGRMHESIVPSVDAYAASRGLTLATTPVCIDHYGFEGDQTHKIVRNIPLLEAEVEANPGRAYCWYHLAEMLVLDGRLEQAISICRQGLASASEVGSRKNILDRRLIAHTLVRILVEEDRDASDVLSRLLKDDPNDFVTLYLSARASLRRGDNGYALRIGRRLVAVEPDELQDSLTAYDVRLFGEFAWALIGAAHYQAGRRAEAGEAYAQAMRLAPSNTAYLSKAVALGARVSEASV